MCHHPFHEPANAPMRIATRRGSRAAARIARSRADLLLCGHVHVPTADVRQHDGQGFLTLTAGTLSTRLRQKPPSFNRIILRPDRIDAENWIWENKDFVPTPLATYDR
jgi:3',5'-cyclic AMP phosphodiesterase CpdA